MRIACALITHLRAKVELHRRTELNDRTPAAIADRTKKRPLIVDALPGASGVLAGMTLDRAMSLHAGLIVLDSDESYYRRVFDGALNALSAVSDRVEGAELGVAYVGLSGLERLYGGEEGAASAVLDALPAYLLPRAGAADSKFCSYLAARLCEGGKPLLAPPDAAPWLAPMPVDLLPASPALRRDLRRFGFRTMGAVAAMGADALADRFGAEGLRVWRLCHGLDDSPLVARRPSEPLVESLSLPVASASLQTLCAAADMLLKRVFGRPAMLNAAAESAALSSGRWSLTARFKTPARRWRDASAVVRSRLELRPPESPVEELALSVSVLRGDSGRQLGLFEDVRDANAARLLEEADRKLRPVAGASAGLRKVVEISGWHPAPEMRFLTIPIDQSRDGESAPLYAPLRLDALENADGSPASLLVNGGWRRVERVDESWTFDLWWLPKPLSRFYYRVNLSDGSRLTVFRDLRGGGWYRQRA